MCTYELNNQYKIYVQAVDMSNPTVNDEYYFRTILHHCGLRIELFLYFTKQECCDFLGALSRRKKCCMNRNGTGAWIIHYTNGNDYCEIEYKYTENSLNKFPIKIPLDSIILIMEEVQEHFNNQNSCSIK